MTRAIHTTDANVNQGINSRCKTTFLMRELMRIVEAYSAGGYSAVLWRRWWGNSVTGTVLPVALHEDHDAYFLAHLDEFFTEAELARLPNAGDEPYEDAAPDDEVQSANDELLVAAYSKGWLAIIYDGNNRHLSLRSTDRGVDWRGLRKIIRTITGDVVVDRLIMDVGREYRLDAEDIARFVKFGKLPPS
jgi:hypothetical protein